MLALVYTMPEDHDNKALPEDVEENDLLGAVPQPLATAKSLRVNKEWQETACLDGAGRPRRRSGGRDPSRTLLILTGRERYRVTPSPVTKSRFAKILVELRPSFSQVFARGQQVMAMEADTGRHILASGHIADANLTHNGYCLAIQPTKKEIITLKTFEFQLLYASYYYRHKKIERITLLKQWVGIHDKVFKTDDIIRNLSLVFEVTPRTIYNDLKFLTKNAE